MNKITTFVIDSEQLKKLKSILALEGISVSAWLRNKIDAKIDQTEKTLRSQ
jgi:hypothetical protein